MKHHLTLAVAAALALGGSFAHAADAGDWVFKIGAHNVDPKSNNGTLADGAFKAKINSNARPTFTLEYMTTPNWGIEVLAAFPFQHDIKLNGVKAGSVKHLPPTVSVQYHFNPNGSVSPFIGVGANYTWIYSEHATGPLAGTTLKVGNSFGPALHAGLDFKFNERWMFTVDARWISIDATTRVNGADVGKVHIDPFIYGVAVGYRF